jgi:hypothetical protein
MNAHTVTLLRLSGVAKIAHALSLRMRCPHRPKIAAPLPVCPQPFGRALTLPPRSGQDETTGVRAGYQGCGLLTSADGDGASSW